ncbi:MAG: hypothetical protein KTR25_13155 [Myxococcales bacterium]|nr:hypothetical protein [Myxococcales bacterium]
MHPKVPGRYAYRPRLRFNLFFMSKIVFFFTVICIPLNGYAEPLVVIVSKKLPVKDLPKGMIQLLFLGETVEATGKRLFPLNLSPEAPERQSFDEKMLGISPKDMPRFWIDQRIRGKNKPPKTIPSMKLLLRLVAKLPGAIGYVPESAVTEAVQIVAIDGKRPTDRDYALK